MFFYFTGGVSDKELEDLAEQLISLDTVNNATEYITLNLQGRTTPESSRDEAAQPYVTRDFYIKFMSREIN